jgi:hypothetical protein
MPPRWSQGSCRQAGFYESSQPIPCSMIWPPSCAKLSYVAKHMDGLKLFLDDGTAEMDSNTVECRIRPIALNRKNALFASHDEDGRDRGHIASLIETCTLNNVEPYAYLKATLEAIAARHSAARFDELMPWNSDKSGRHRLRPNRGIGSHPSHRRISTGKDQGERLMIRSGPLPKATPKTELKPQNQTRSPHDRKPSNTRFGNNSLSWCGHHKTLLPYCATRQSEAVRRGRTHPPSTQNARVFLAKCQCLSWSRRHFLHRTACERRLSSRRPVAATGSFPAKAPQRWRPVSRPARSLPDQELSHPDP